MGSLKWYLQIGCFICLSLFNLHVHAQVKIAILQFELKDLTLAPGIPAELERTASIKPTLETELDKAGYVLIEIDEKSQQDANAGVGYLFDHPDVAAKLARKFDVDYIVVGRLHKPSFLFAYLMAHLIKAEDGKMIGSYISEAKGPSQKLTRKAVESLTVKIDHALEGNYSPP